MRRQHGYRSMDAGRDDSDDTRIEAKDDWGWPMITKIVRDHLEQAIDSTTLADVLEAIADICAEKSAYIMETWQDRSLSQRWLDAARMVRATSEKLPACH